MARDLGSVRKLKPNRIFPFCNLVLVVALKTEYMNFGDTIRIEAERRDGQSVFG